MSQLSFEPHPFTRPLSLSGVLSNWEITNMVQMFIFKGRYPHWIINIGGIILKGVNLLPRTNTVRKHSGNQDILLTHNIYWRFQTRIFVKYTMSDARLGKIGAIFIRTIVFLENFFYCAHYTFISTIKKHSEL